MALQTYDGLEALDRGQVLEEVGVRDLARSPLANVGGVVDERGVPLALVVGVGLEGPLPLAASRCLLALGVADGGGDPVAVLLIVPFLRLLSVYCKLLYETRFEWKRE